MAKMPDMTVRVDVVEVSALQELAEEFRRLGAEADRKAAGARHAFYEGQQIGQSLAFLHAAQMLEERLNG